MYKLENKAHDHNKKKSIKIKNTLWMDKKWMVKIFQPQKKESTEIQIDGCCQP